MNLRQIQDIAGHRDVPPWVIKLVQDVIEHDRMYERPSRAAMQMALEALEVSTDWDVGARGKQLQSMKAITALREALAEQAEQEPVGRWNWNEAKFEWLTKFDYYKHHMTPLYASPVRTKDLTDDEIDRIACNVSHKEFARAVIAADREKNK